jgi:hypothetical protein
VIPKYPSELFEKTRELAANVREMEYCVIPNRPRSLGSRSQSVSQVIVGEILNATVEKLKLWVGNGYSSTRLLLTLWGAPAGDYRIFWVYLVSL